MKGMYALARQGGLSSFTGVDDPYEPPRHPELTLETVDRTPQENARRVLEHLLEHGYLHPPTAQGADGHAGVTPLAGARRA